MGRLVAGISALLDRAGAVGGRYQRPIRDALILVGIGRAFIYFVVQGIHPWTFVGVDARAYWRVDLADPYATSTLGELSNYLYSPAFAQATAPLSILPFEAFYALWLGAMLACLVWLVRPWPWALLMLVLPISYELFVGNIHYFIAVAIVLGFRTPATWVLPVLTKVTPGIGLLWYPVRRQWRRLSIALGAIAAVCMLSFVLSPSAWVDWIRFLLASPGGSELLLPRLLIGAVLVAFGAATGRRWMVPVAVFVSLPVVWINSWVILLAVIRLRDRSTSAPGIVRST